MGRAEAKAGVQPLFFEVISEFNKPRPERSAYVTASAASQLFRKSSLAMAADDPAAAIFYIPCAGFNRVEKFGYLGLQRYRCSVLSNALPRLPEVSRAKSVVRATSQTTLP